MPDEPNGGGKPDSELEMAPQWGAAAEGEKPKHVAVRKEGDVTEAMKPSAADAVYQEETEVESVKVATERKIGLAIVVLLGLALAAVVVWKILKVEVEFVEVKAFSSYKTNELVLDAKVRTTHDVQVRVEGLGDAKAIPPGESELKFQFPIDKLELGENALKLQVMRSGAVLKEFEFKGYRDFKLKIDKNKVAIGPDHLLLLRFDLAQGWKVRVNKVDYEPTPQGHAVVKLPMDKVYSKLTAFKDPNYRIDVPVTVIRANGDPFVYLQKIEFLLPQAPLELDVRGDAVVVDGKKVKIAGKTDAPPRPPEPEKKKKRKKGKRGKKAEPEAKAPPKKTVVVKVDGEEVPVDENGHFEVAIKLPKSKKFNLKGAKDYSQALTAIRSAIEEGRGKEIKIVVKVPKKVPSTMEILAIRSKAKWVRKFKKLAKSAPKGGDEGSNL